jgi:hypothetical protein
MEMGQYPKRVTHPCELFDTESENDLAQRSTNAGRFQAPRPPSARAVYVRTRPQRGLAGVFALPRPAFDAHRQHHAGCGLDFTVQAAELRHLPMEPRTVLRIALAIGCRTLAESVGGICHVARETSIEAKASEQSPTSVGGRRFVVLAGERCIRWAGCEYADPEHWSEPRNHSRRGGNL